MIQTKEKKAKFVLLITLFLTACNPASEAEQDKQMTSKQSVTEQIQSEGTTFERPKDQYGLKYWVGNLGGKAVKLPPTIFTVWEYDDSPDIWGGTKEEMEEYKKRPRTYDSVIKSMSYEMRYTDGMLLERYYKAPQSSAEQYEAEKALWNSPWLRIHFESGKRYGSGDMNSTWRSIMSGDKNSITSYHSSGIKIYELNEYKLDKLPNYGVIRDLYVSGKDQNNIDSIIYCHDNNFGGGCEQIFLLTPTFKARAIVNYRRENLKDWKLIQQRVKESIKPYIINAQ